MLRVKKYKRYIEDVHEIWTQHLFNNLPFEQFDNSFLKTDDKPKFLAIDTSSFK